MLFADADSAAALSGASGWVGAGLLGLVLGWLLLRHLPAKDVQIEKMIVGRDQLVKDVTETNNISSAERAKVFAASVEKMAVMWQASEAERRSDFRTALQMVIDHCQRENSSRDNVMSHSVDEITQAVGDLRMSMEEFMQFQKTMKPKES